MTRPIRVLIVDDSALIRQMFQEMLSSEPGMEVVAVASDPYDAREKIKLHNPDVLTLDIEMPKMDGLTFLEKIMSLRPLPVIMVSSLTQKGAEETIRALEIGAVDYLGKPVVNQTRETIGRLRQDLIEKVYLAANAKIRSRTLRPDSEPAPAIVPFNPPGNKPRHVIAIGSSTGGVEALREIFLRLPKNAPPIVVTQHMPEKFTKSFAARLSSLSQVSVSEAENHARLRQGHAYIAPGGERHLKIVKVGSELVCKLEEGDPVSGHRPSVDVLFRSIAESAGKDAVGVMLTGMGKDGAEGMRAMRDMGAYNIGQNAATCVVYGMPKVALAAGAIHAELPLLEIPAAMLKYCEKA